MRALFLALVLLHPAALPPSAPPLEVTFIANDGFLVSAGPAKVLIDALFNTSFGQFGVPSDGLRAEIVEGQPPFERIALFLVTHDHGDHFFAPYVAEFLDRHPETRLIAPRGACEKLDQGRAGKEQVAAVDLEVGGSEERTAGGIRVKVFRLKHMRDDTGTRIPSLVYLVELNGHRILHIGDAPIEANLEAYGRLHLDREKVDVLFLGYSERSEPAVRFIREVVKPGAVVAMHIPPTEFEAESKAFRDAYPNAVVFRAEKETRSFRK